MPKAIKIGNRWVGKDCPIFIMAEIGINHNGDIDIAKQLVDTALHIGVDAVKFQKRNPEKCVPHHMRDHMRETPWGYITYFEYRQRIEFSLEDYHEIDRYCREKGMTWFSSCWDEDSIDFMARFEPPCYKIPSALLTDRDYLEKLRETERPLILSTGMSSIEQIRTAVDILGDRNLLIAHCTSTYPCPNQELNLRVIRGLRKEFGCPVGYSGHEVGLATTLAAVALGACFVERHITLNRAMWGTDHPSSVEPQGFARMIKDIRNIEVALGDGVKRVYQSEIPVMQRLRSRNTL